MHRDVREDELPGIGRRYTVGCDDDGVLTIVILNGGRRDIYVTSSQAREPQMVSMDDEKAHAVGEVLAGEFFTSPEVRGAEGVLEELETKWVELTPGSPGTGRTLADLGVSSITGVTIMSILRGKSVIHEPTGFEVLRAGDRLVVAGRHSNMAAFARLVTGG